MRTDRRVKVNKLGKRIASKPATNVSIVRYAAKIEKERKRRGLGG